MPYTLDPRPYTLKCGFTLIELLVVIGIIAVLASILFPVFTKAREKGREATCISNQRQLALAIMDYTKDSGEVLPQSSNVWSAINIPAPVGSSQTGNSSSSQGTAGILQCPSAPQLSVGYIYNTRVSGLSLGDPSLRDPTSIFLTADGYHSAQAATQLYVIFITDTSGSMAGWKINTLNNAMAQVIPQIQTTAQQHAGVNIIFGALQFDATPYWHVNPTPIAQVTGWQPEIVPITYGPDTNMGAALSMLSTYLAVPPMPATMDPPVLVLMSDGMPTDNFDVGLSALMAQQWGKSAIRRAVAIGTGDNNAVLNQFIGDPSVTAIQGSDVNSLTNAILSATTNGLSQSLSTTGNFSFNDFDFNRHGGKLIASFLDGHVEAATVNQATNWLATEENMTATSTIEAFVPMTKNAPYNFPNGAALWKVQQNSSADGSGSFTDAPTTSYVIVPGDAGVNPAPTVSVAFSQTGYYDLVAYNPADTTKFQVIWKGAVDLNLTFATTPSGKVAAGTPITVDVAHLGTAFSPVITDWQVLLNNGNVAGPTPVAGATPGVYTFTFDTAASPGLYAFGATIAGVTFANAFSLEIGGPSSIGTPAFFGMTPGTTVTLDNVGAGGLWAQWGAAGSGFPWQSGASTITLSPVEQHGAGMGYSPTKSASSDRILTTWAAQPTPTDAADAVTGAGNGFTIAVPADTTKRHVEVYWSGATAECTAAATLSDGAPPAGPVDAGTDPTGDAVGYWAIDYQAGYPNQTLTITLTQVGAGTLYLQGLREYPSP